MSLSKKFHKDPSFRCEDIYKMIPDFCNHQFSMDFAYFQTTLDHDHAHTIPFRTIQDFKRPKRTKYIHSVQNNTRPNETILDPT